jgi:hypothetical protein
VGLNGAPGNGPKPVIRIVAVIRPVSTPEGFPTSGAPTSTLHRIADWRERSGVAGGQS